MANILTFNEIYDSLKKNDSESLLHFGGCFDDSMIVKNLKESDKQYKMEYQAIDADYNKWLKWESLYSGFGGGLYNVSMQDFISEMEVNYDTILITGIFDNIVYGEEQYNFIIKTIEECYKKSNKSVVFTLKQKPNDDFEYNVIYLFAVLSVSYENLVIKKFSDNGDNQYIFSILK